MTGHFVVASFQAITIKLLLNAGSQRNARGFDACLLINAGFKINAGLQQTSRQSEHRAIGLKPIHTHNTVLENTLCTTKCANFTPLSILDDDDKRININTWYSRYYNM